MPKANIRRWATLQSISSRSSGSKPFCWFRTSFPMLSCAIISCRKYNGMGPGIEDQYAAPMEAHLLDKWPKLMKTDAITAEERKLIDQWLTSTLKTDEGKWFQYPGELVFIIRFRHLAGQLILDHARSGPRGIWNSRLL